MSDKKETNKETNKEIPVFKFDPENPDKFGKPTPANEAAKKATQEAEKKEKSVIYYTYGVSSKKKEKS